MNLSCPNCGTRNSNERQFCGQCGHSMLITCEQCQFHNAPGDKFCGGCGVMVAVHDIAPRPSMEFPNLPQPLRAELSGVDSPEPDELCMDSESTDEVATLFDPDDNDDSDAQPVVEPVLGEGLVTRMNAVNSNVLQEVPTKHFTLLRVDLKLAAGQNVVEPTEQADDAVEQFAKFAQHTVEYVGGERLHAQSDSLLWGFTDLDPVVAAQRAAAASMELLSSVELFNFQQGCDFHFHIGLASGQVQLDETTTPATAQGRVVELSKIISSLAPSGGVYLCQHTFDCLDGIHRAGLVGQVQEPETGETLTVQQLCVDAVMQDDESPAYRSLIGRENEIKNIVEQLQQNLAEECGSWVMVSGTPGIGKTRLLEELHHNASEHRAESLWYSMANDSHAPRPCILNALAQQVASLRHPGLTLEQVHQRLTEELLLGAEQQLLLGSMFALTVSDAEENPQLVSRCDLLARLFSHRRASPGLMLMIEDIHWASDSMKHRLALLCDRLADSPTLIVFSSRDCFEQEGYSFGSDMPGRVLTLTGLNTAAAFTLSSSFLPVHTPIVKDCVARASGNPLFLTQQLQAAIDTIDQCAPSSLRGIVLAKMQRLQPEDLEQLQAAAVLGSRLTVGAWSGLLGGLPDSCDHLIQQQFICADSAGYRFSHDLVHSVVYRSIEKAQQQELHLKAAQYHETNAEVAAWHYLKAGEPLSGVAQVLEAGTRALVRGELARAAQLLDALQDVDEAQLARSQRYQLHRLRGDCHTQRAAHLLAIGCYEQAVMVADEGEQLSRTQLLMAASYGSLGNTAEAMQLLGEVLAQSRRDETPVLETRALQLRAQLLFQAGRYAEAESDLRAGLYEVQHSVDLQTKIDISQSLGELLVRQSKVREAEQLLSDAHQQRDRQRHGSGWGDRDPWLGQCLYFLGDVCGARDILQSAVEHAKSVGDQSALLQARCLLGPVLLDLGEPASALANGKLAMSADVDDKNENLVSMAMVSVGESHIRLGKYALGLQMLTQAWSRSESTNAKYSTGPWALAALATVVQRDVEQRNLLAKGEYLLNSGAEGLSHFWFYRLAIQVALGGGDERLARRYAKLLQDFENGQELPWVQQACSGLTEVATPQVLVSPLN